MGVPITEDSASKVALLAEGVDRNAKTPISLTKKPWSPSSRRAWIEMFNWRPVHVSGVKVALLAEGVDRNIYE